MEGESYVGREGGERGEGGPMGWENNLQSSEVYETRGGGGGGGMIARSIMYYLRKPNCIALLFAPISHKKAASSYVCDG